MSVNKFGIISRDYTVDTRAYYAQDLDGAIALAAKHSAEENGHEWEVFQIVDVKSCGAPGAKPEATAA